MISHSIVVHIGRGLQLWRENKVVGDTYLVGDVDTPSTVFTVQTICY